MNYVRCNRRLGTLNYLLGLIVIDSWFPPIQCLCYRGGGVAFYDVSWLAASCFTVVLFVDYDVFRFRQYLYIKSKHVAQTVRKYNKYRCVRRSILDCIIDVKTLRDG